MDEKRAKERYDGVWNGVNVSFGRIQFGRRLTEAECEALCRDEDVVVKGVTGKSGVRKDVVAHLAYMAYAGRQYVGVEAVKWLPAEGGLP